MEGLDIPESGIRNRGGVGEMSGSSKVRSFPKNKKKKKKSGRRGREKKRKKRGEEEEEEEEENG